MADEQTTNPAPPPAEPPPAEPVPFTFKAPVHWQLKGEAMSRNLDLTIELCVEVGLWLKRTAPGVYRVAGTLEQIEKAGEWMQRTGVAPIRFAIEEPPEIPNLRFEVHSERPPPRVAEIHGQQESFRWVARAIDAGLGVRRIGVKHYRMAGATCDHIAWVSTVLEVPRAMALQIMNLTEARAAAEDAASPLPPINVILPTRQTLAEITRDARGDITQIKQTERTVK